MLERDPGYLDRLHLVGSAQLVKGWLEGDWTATEGAFFDCWSEERHVIQPFPIPRECDWGSVSPFSLDGGQSSATISRWMMAARFRAARSFAIGNGTGPAPS
jgi:hypothetical protein